jgi:aryl-alcohol dehydrogenase-like predicted oxidoreductase
MSLATRRLGRSSLELTVLGCGTWAIGGPSWRRGWGEQPQAQSIRTLLRAIETGVNWIDTAPLYGNGEAERIVGEVLEGVEAKPLVATKCGVREVDGTMVVDLSPTSLLREHDESRSRLRVDRIGLLQLHVTGDDDDALARAWRTLAELRAAGEVDAIGVSNIDTPRLRALEAIAPVDACQPSYSLLDRAIEESLLPYCRTAGIGVIGYSPQASGLLTGAMSRARLAALPADDWRARGDTFPYVEPFLARGLALVEALRPIAESLDWTPGQLALAWVMAQPGVTSAIVGVRSPRQLDDAVAATRVPLTQEALAAVGEAVATLDAEV